MSFASSKFVIYKAMDININISFVKIYLRMICELSENLNYERISNYIKDNKIKQFLI